MYAADINEADQGLQVNPDPRVNEEHKTKEKTTKHSQHVSDKNTPIQIDSVKGEKWAIDDGEGNRLIESIMTTNKKEAKQGPQMIADPRASEKHKRKEKMEPSHHVSNKDAPIQIDAVKGATWASDNDKGNRLNKSMRMVDKKEANQGPQMTPDPPTSENYKRKEKTKHSQHVSHKNMPVQFHSVKGAKRMSGGDEGKRLIESIKTTNKKEVNQGPEMIADARASEEHKRKEKTKPSHHVSNKDATIQIDSVGGAKRASDDDEGNRLNEKMNPPQEHNGANENTCTDAATQSKRGADCDEHDASPPAIPVRCACDPSSAHRTSGLNDASPPSQDKVSVVPIAMMVTDDDRNEAEVPNRESIVIATRVSPSQKTRLRMCIALAILVLCGTIAGVVYAVVKPPPPSPSTLPFTPKPPSMSPTQEPTYTILSRVGQSLIEEEIDITNNATTTTGPRGELYFGWSVDLSSNGERLAITSPFLNAVYLYEMLDGNWQRIANIVETDLVDHIALSGDGTVLAIGMPSNDDTRDDGGKIQVYQEATDGKFEKRGQAIYGMSAGDRIGGYNDDDTQSAFDNDLYQDEILSTESYDSSSMALSENGTILAMGSPIGNYVRVFVLDVAQNKWVLYGDNTVFVGEAQGDKFGTSVSMSADGTRVVIGAQNNTGKADPSYWIYNGHARVFQYMQETRTWIKLGQGKSRSCRRSAFGTTTTQRGN